MSRKIALAARLVAPVVAPANGISGCAAIARPAASRRGRLDLEPEHDVGVDAEDRLVEVDVEVEQACFSQFLDPAADGRLMPVGGRRQVGDRGAAVAGQLGQEGVVFWAEHGVCLRGGDPGLVGAQRGRVGRRVLGAVRRGLGGGGGQRGELVGRQGPGVGDVRDRGEHVQDGLRGDAGDVTAARQPGQEERVALLGGARLQRADDLGAARVQPHPARIRPLGEGVGDTLGAARGDLQADHPVDPAGSRPVDEAGHPQVGGFDQAAVPTRDRLVGDAERGRQHPERRPRGHDQSVEKLAVNLVELTGFHG